MQKNTDSFNIAITGAAGFIGSHLVRRVLAENFHISFAVDSLKPSYGGNFSKFRQSEFIPQQEIEVLDIMDQDPETLATMFGDSQVLIHLAAFPGIRMGELKSHEYLINNVGNSSLIIEACKLNDSVKAIIFASSSSVYGDQGFENPCKEDQVDPMQLKSQYAMTKLINEIQFQRAAKTLNIPIIGLRFFTVFGEWGRPDMAYSKFTNSILTGKRVQIYGPDGGYRNMTHVDDVVEIMIRLIKLIKTKNFVLESNYEVFNLASDKIIQTKELAQKIGSILNMQVNFDIVNRPKGDAIGTRANLEKISQFIGKLNPRNFDDDLKNYVKWHVIHQKLFNLI